MSILKDSGSAAVFFLFAVLCTACSAQRVSTSTFLSPAGLQGAPQPGNKISVISNEQAPNPIFDAMVKAKLEASLIRHGYIPAESAQAPYHLKYAYDLQGDINPVRRTFFTFPGAQGFYATGSNGYDSYFGAGLGFGTFVNDPHTIYMAKLRLRLSRPVPGQSGQEEVLWVGEAAAETDKPDLRDMMNYLIPALFRYFMRDSLETKTIKLSDKDVEVRALSERASAKPRSAAAV